MSEISQHFGRKNLRAECRNGIVWVMKPLVCLSVLDKLDQKPDKDTAAGERWKYKDKLMIISVKEFI